MKKILTESEITDFLNKYCPGTVLKQSLGVTYVESVNNEPFKIVRETNGSEISLTLIAYEYAFVKRATEKFERLEFPQYTYYLDYEPDIEFSLCGEEVECDIAITLARNERKYFELTLDSGLRICGLESSDHVDSSYRLTLRRVDGIDPRCSVEYVQELARDFVDDMLSDFTAYASHKN
jgi:hypothetical protein